MNILHMIMKKAGYRLGGHAPCGRGLRRGDNKGWNDTRPFLYKTRRENIPNQYFLHRKCP